MVRLGDNVDDMAVVVMNGLAMIGDTVLMIGVDVDRFVFKGGSKSSRQSNRRNTRMFLDRQVPPPPPLLSCLPSFLLPNCRPFLHTLGLPSGPPPPPHSLHHEPPSFLHFLALPPSLPSLPSVTLFRHCHPSLPSFTFLPFLQHKQFLVGRNSLDSFSKSSMMSDLFKGGSSQ
jgi:hypothetical protein